MTDVHWLVAPTTDVLATWAGLERCFGAAEATRLAGLRQPQRRDDAVAAHIAVRVCAARVVDVRADEIDVEQRCAECGGPHGRPRLAGRPDVGLSLAHTAGWVAAVAGPAPIGIDLERVDRLRYDECPVGLAAHAREQPGLDHRRSVAEFMRLWVRKEALVKAGATVLDGLRDVDLSALGPAGGVWGDVRLQDLPPEDPAVVGSVAVPAGARPTWHHVVVRASATAGR